MDPVAAGTATDGCQVTLTGRLAPLGGVAAIRFSDRHGTRSARALVDVPTPFQPACSVLVVCPPTPAFVAPLEQIGVGGQVCVAGWLRSGSDDGGGETAQLIARAITVPAAGTPEGSHVAAIGSIEGVPRFGRHPAHPATVLALVTLRVAEAAPLLLLHRLPCIVPRAHPAAPALLRPGNQVAISGWIERVRIPLSADRQAAARDAILAEHQRRSAVGSTEQRATLERRTAAALRRSAVHDRTRIIVGAAVLLDGAPLAARAAARQPRGRPPTPD
ncbi:MAG: hypothetical protein KGS47_14780 [Chloroflexi bacterium]|nr:hypothetical protein [Chloroflexota bacterium]